MFWRLGSKNHILFFLFKSLLKKKRSSFKIKKVFKCTFKVEFLWICKLPAYINILNKTRTRSLYICTTIWKENKRRVCLKTEPHAYMRLVTKNHSVSINTFFFHCDVSGIRNWLWLDLPMDPLLKSMLLVLFYFVKKTVYYCV